MYEESIYLNRLVNIGYIFKKVVFTLHKQIEENGNEIQFESSEGVPLIVADAARLEQIIINLIQNANKFTEDGMIKINLKASTDKIFIKIADTGIGIPSHDINKIWERFFKVNRVRSKKEGGTGLGLAIVKELVELHKGTIEVESEIGIGTTFIIELPIRS